MKLEKSNNSCIIKSQIKKIETKIANNDAFRENALQLRQELRIQKRSTNFFLETIRNHCT